MRRALICLLALTLGRSVWAEAPLRQGILVVAHGGDARWNEHVKEVASRVRAITPAEPAFLMGVPDQRPEEAYAKLAAAGVRQVVIVPLFVSSWSDHYEQVRFIGGLRPDYPHAEHMKLSRVGGAVPVAGVTNAMDDHPLVAAILADRARELSKDPAHESLVIVAHGPNPDDEAEKWNANIRSLGERVRAATGIAEVDVRLLRDDAPKPVKDQALAELRASVEERARKGGVIVVPLLMAPGRVAQQIPGVLSGLTFRWSGKTLLPDDRVADWVLEQARGRAGTKAGRADADADATATPRYAEQVVVTGTRTERPAGEVPVQTEVIGHEVIAATGSRSMSDVLAHCSGIEVAPSLAGHSIQLQGLGGRSVLLLVDGQEVLGKISGEVDLGNLLVHDVDRVEVVKGAGSALYGSDALGGVVNVLTRGADRPLTVSGEQRFESLRGQTTSVSGGARTGPWSFFGSGSRIRRGSYDLVPSEPTTTGSEYTKAAISGRAAYRWNPRTELSASVRHYDEDAADVSVSRGVVFDDRVFDERWQGLTALRAGVGATGALSVRGHHTEYSHRFDRVRRTTGALTPDLTRERLHEVELQYDQPVGSRHLLTVGGELKQAGMNSDRLDGRERHATTTVGFVQDEWYAHDRVRVVGGFRYDHNSAFGSAWSPKLAALVRLNANLRLRGAFGEGFKAPEFKDLYFLFGNRAAGYQVIGNPDLRPESSRTLSAGLEGDAWSGRLKGSVSVFRNRVLDLIDSALVGLDAGTGLLTFQTSNLGAVRTRGAEADLALAPSARVGVGVSYNLLDADDTSSGEPLVGRARHSLKGRAIVRLERTQLALFGRYLGRRPFADTNQDGRIDEHAPGVFFLDGRVAQAVGRHVQLVVGGENLLDRADPRYLPTPGRRLYAGLVVRHERN